MSFWADQCVFYQIYPLGFAGAPFENDGIERNGILKIVDWIPHLSKLGIGALYLCPIFESDNHGYNTRDYKKIDVRLGSNDDFRRVVDSLHSNGIKVVIDGVFNHVGRGFPQFLDVVKNRENSAYRYWFNINLDGNTHFNDGLWYEGWEGNQDLVKLNLRNGEVVDFLLDAVKFWIEEFDIDGIRLDVAYSLDHDFIKRLRSFTAGIKQDFVLIGEMLHGDYNRIMNDEMLHSVTNYECYKGLYSSFNSANMFEIMHSLKRQFGEEYWTLYKGKHLLNFVDNHDVSRVATILNDKRHLPLIYALLFGMPGMPCVYYGSEWGALGDKRDGDPTLRPAFDYPVWNELTDMIAKLSKIKSTNLALNYGDLSVPVLTNKQCVFSRRKGTEQIYVAINMDDKEYLACFSKGSGDFIDLLTGSMMNADEGVVIPPYTAMFLKNKEIYYG